MELIGQLSSLLLEKVDTNKQKTVSPKQRKKLEAKLKELRQWKCENVYEEVPNQGKDSISLR